MTNTQGNATASPQNIPTGVTFQQDTLFRLGYRGDNWCITWAAEDSQNTSMDDGKWISDSRRKMILIWSDAMKNEAGKSHTTNYKWNQMAITIE